MENGYSICLNKWVLDKEIKNELGLLLIISSLSAEKGYCFASNEYLSKTFKIDESTISRKLKKLEEKGYITVEYEKRGFEIKSRKIQLTKMSTVDLQKCQSTIDEKVKDNNTSINNTRLIKENTKRNFAKFWEAYPRKVSKGNAEKWFIKNNPSEELVNKMINKIFLLKETEQWKKSNGQFIPYPSSWLNAKGWEDEIKEEKPIRELISDGEGGFQLI